MAEHPGYMTLEDIQNSIGVGYEEIRVLVSVLGIQPYFFPEDKRRRYYKKEDVERIRRAIEDNRKA